MITNTEYHDSYSLFLPSLGAQKGQTKTFTAYLNRKNSIEFARLKFNMYFCKQNIKQQIITKTNGKNRNIGRNYASPVTQRQRPFHSE